MAETPSRYEEPQRAFMTDGEMLARLFVPAYDLTGGKMPEPLRKALDTVPSTENDLTYPEIQDKVKQLRAALTTAIDDGDDNVASVIRSELNEIGKQNPGMKFPDPE